MLNYCGYFLGNFWNDFGSFLIYHLVTLNMSHRLAVLGVTAALHLHDLLGVLLHLALKGSRSGARMEVIGFQVQGLARGTVENRSTLPRIPVMALMTY